MYSLFGPKWGGPHKSCRTAASPWSNLRTKPILLMGRRSVVVGPNINSPQMFPKFCQTSTNTHSMWGTHISNRPQTKGSRWLTTTPTRCKMRLNNARSSVSNSPNSLDDILKWSASFMCRCESGIQGLGLNDHTVDTFCFECVLPFKLKYFLLNLRT